MHNRGVSETLSYVLVFSLILVTVIIGSFGGIDVIQSTEESQRIQNTERAFSILANNMEDIHTGGAPSRATEISIDEASLQYGNLSTINVTVVDSGTTTNRTYDVRPFVYETDEEQRLVYEAGAIFYENSESGVVVRDPPYVLSNRRAIVPVVATQTSSPSRQYTSETVLVRANGVGENVSIGDNDGTYDDVYLNVTSERADLWEQYLQSTGMEDCRTGETGDGDAFVECHLDSSPTHVSVSVDYIEMELE